MKAVFSLAPSHVHSVVGFDCGRNRGPLEKPGMWGRDGERREGKVEMERSYHSGPCDFEAGSTQLKSGGYLLAESPLPREVGFHSVRAFSQ